MSQYSMTRVELHGASTEAEYDGLHRVLAQNGFLRTVKGEDGIVRELPTAMYSSEVADGITAYDLRDTVVSIVQGYWPKPKNFEAICTLGPSSWWNLL